VELDGPFKGRLAWNGSQDLQEVSIRIINVTFNDSGVYECNVSREFEFDFYKPSAFIVKTIQLKVEAKGAANGYTLCSICSRPVLGFGRMLRLLLKLRSQQKRCELFARVDPTSKVIV